MDYRYEAIKNFRKLYSQMHVRGQPLFYSVFSYISAVFTVKS